MTDDRETCVERIQNDKYTNIYTSERKFINELNTLKEQYPDDVIIEHINRDGSICAKVPYNWFRFVKPPTKRNYTEEQKEEMKIKNWLIHKLDGISKEELFLPVQYTVYRPMVKKINEHDQFFKVKCDRCGSYLLFERKDEMKNWYEDMKIWWVECPECNNHVTTYEIANGKAKSHMINE